MFIHYALITAQAALADSGVKIDGQNDRVGVSIGTGMGGVPMLLNSWDMLQREGMLGVSAYALPGSLPNMAAGWVSMRSGARGPSSAPRRPAPRAARPSATPSARSSAGTPT